MTLTSASRRDRRTGAVSGVLAGLLFLLFAIPTLLGVVPINRPGVTTLEGLLLVPPVVCLGASGLARARRDGLATSGRIGATLAVLGSAAVATSAMALGIGALASPADRVAVIAFIGGGCLAGLGTVLVGVGHLVDRPLSAAGIALVTWPGLSLLTFGFFVLFGVGSAVTAVVAPFGLALVVDGGSRLRQGAPRPDPARSVGLAER